MINKKTALFLVFVIISIVFMSSCDTGALIPDDFDFANIISDTPADEVSCKTCEDTKEVTCNKCKGSKTENCIICNGTGRKDCIICHGTGWKTCFSCGGIGTKSEFDFLTHSFAYKPCTSCVGGRVFCISTQTCTSCNLGKVSCMGCFGHGTISCPDCE